MLKTEPIFPGFPDDVVLGPDRFVEFVEFKTPVGSLEPSQVYAHNILARLGWNVKVIRSIEEFRQLVG